jgi:hypothetical protein
MVSVTVFTDSCKCIALFLWKCLQNIDVSGETEYMFLGFDCKNWILFFDFLILILVTTYGFIRTVL